jgi:dimethylglycine dehydrogenase
MWSCDPRRFTAFCDQDYCVAKGMEVYGHEYAIHFPHHAWPAGRGKKLSPIHDRITAAGAQFGAYNGWERANWFARPGDDTSEEATQTFRREGAWFDAVKEECLAVRDAAGLLDLPGFSRFILEGAGAADWLSRQITGAVPAPGRIGLAYFADKAGRVVTEMSVVRRSETEMTLITAAAAQWHDFELLKARLPADLALTDETEAWSTLILCGPKSREVLAAVCGADLHLPWLTRQPAQVAGKPVQLIRVCFAGELGWEVHAAVDDMPEIHASLVDAGAPLGLKPFGMFALDSLRIEKSYRAWKGDLSTDYTMLQAGLERFIRWDKPDFVGKEALLAEREKGPTKRFVTLVVEAGDCDAPYMSTLWQGDSIVGETTSGAWGHRVGKSVALGVLRSDLAQAGTRLEVEIFGERYAAEVQPEAPLWDPRNERLKS